MNYPTPQSIAQWLANHGTFQQWLGQTAGQDVASLQNDPNLNAIREEFNQQQSMSRDRLDDSPNVNVDMATFMSGVELARNMGRTAQKPENMSELLTAINQSLGNSQNLLVQLINYLKAGYQGEGVVDTTSPQVGDAPDIFNATQEGLIKEVLPHVESAASKFRNLSNYFDSIFHAQEQTSPASADVGDWEGEKPLHKWPESVTSKKHSIVTKYQTGIKSLQDAEQVAEDLYQFADSFPYFVISYDGLQVLCSFKDSCKELKDKIKNLQSY